MKELDAAQAQLDAGKAQLNSQKADVTTQLRDAITELDKQIPELEKKIASLQTDLDEANRKLENAKIQARPCPRSRCPSTMHCLPAARRCWPPTTRSITPTRSRPIWPKPRSDLNKMGAMINSIDRADAAIRQRAADEGLLEQNMTVEQTAAYLDAQYAAMSARIQALEAENRVAAGHPQQHRGRGRTGRILQAQIDAKRAEQAQDQAVIDGNAAAAPASAS